MPLSSVQTEALKRPDTKVVFQQTNPKKPGSKAFERYEQYKGGSGTVGEASSKGAQWQDLSTDFEKEFMKFDDDKMDTQLQTKRAAPEGTPDKEAAARSKQSARDATPRALSTNLSGSSTSRVEISAATLAALRGMMREELSELEKSMSRRFDDTVLQLRDELTAERQARLELEERVSRLETRPPKQTLRAHDDEDRTVAVIGGFGEQEPEHAEALVRGVLADVTGVVDIYTTSPNPVVAFAQFTSMDSMQKFVRTQKKHEGMKLRKLWAAENKPAAERKRSKIASKIKKFAIELDGFTPRSILVNYKTFRISVRTSTKLTHAAYVAEDGVVEWPTVDGPLSAEVRDAMKDLLADLE